MPIRNMASPNDEIDEQLAQDLENQAVTRLSENLAAKLRNSCDKCNDEIGKAWDTIQNCMTEFRYSKEKMVNTLVKVEGQDRTNRVLQRGLADMVPQKYDEIMAIATTMSDDMAYPSPLTSPQMPTTSNVQNTITGRISSTATPAPSTAMPMAVMTSPGNKPSTSLSPSSANSPRQPVFMKRSSNHLDQPYPTSKKKKTSSPPARSVGGWEVEGAEYIFQYTPFGPGWFVVRCYRGGLQLPFTFTQHPLKDGLALEHFNSKKCKHHDSSRQYTEDEIMTEFGYRVHGDQLSEEWVNKANKRLEADTAKAAATGKGKVGKTGMS